MVMSVDARSFDAGNSDARVIDPATSEARGLDLVSADVPDLNHPEERKRSIYAAFASGDARFDGRVFVGVSSTGIYCRTVCTAKMPKYENCTFFRTAAEAEAAGYRPCLTCRPEVAPGMSSVDARASLARRAAVMLREECANSKGIESVAGRLGYTGRHLRRVFAEEFGVSPSQYMQTCRLLLAKSLLADSNLPISSVAKAAGFGSTRRFDDSFKQHYHLTPSDLRKRSRVGKGPADTVTVRLGYRPPYRFEELLAFFRVRALQGVELVDERSYARTVRLADAKGVVVLGWVRVENDAAKNRLIVTMSESLVPCVPQVVGRIRRMFDLDCDPHSIADGLLELENTVPGSVREGVRLPGCFDAFETCCRAVLGQQVTVGAANKIAARLVAAYGRAVETGIDGLTCAWPTPEDVLALASPESAAETRTADAPMALDSLESAFGQLGIIKTRTRSIASIASLMQSGELDMGPGCNAEEQLERLLSVKGIGPWTANYIAMRAMSYPDAFLESDSGVAHALPDLQPKERLALAESWCPWRSYAVISLWNSLA